MGLFDFFKKITEPTQKDNQTSRAISDINKQIDTLEKEREKVLSSDDLTPKAINGKDRQYHYKDVNIWVDWQFSGRYGKSCESAGMKRGDEVQLRLINNDPEEPKAVGVFWNKQKIGYMKSNSLRDMVRSWRASRLPIRAIISQVGGEQKLFLEFAFYGAPKKYKDAANGG